MNSNIVKKNCSEVFFDLLLLRNCQEFKLKSLAIYSHCEREKRKQKKPTYKYLSNNYKSSCPKLCIAKCILKYPNHFLFYCFVFAFSIKGNINISYIAFIISATNGSDFFGIPAL